MDNPLGKDHWYLLCGALLVALPLAFIWLGKKLEWFEPRADAYLVYGASSSATLQLHQFRAAATSGGATPALLLFHGGGWRNGSPKQFYPQCAFFARNGFTCFSAEYRLGPGHAPDLRGAIEDAASALDYLAKHAGQLNIDVNQLYVGGGSSGGHLAASLGAGLHGEQRRRPAGLVLYNPVIDLAPCQPSHHWVRDDWQAVSPAQSVDSQFPPTLVLTGAEDLEVLPASVQAFCADVIAAGGHCEVEIYPQQAHGFFNDRQGGNPLLEATNQRALQFLRELQGTG